MANQKSLITYSFLVLGFVLSILSPQILKGASPVVIIYSPMFGTVLFILGCARVSQSRGYRWYVGFWGLLNVLGLLVIFTLPNRAITGANAIAGSQGTTPTAKGSSEPSNSKTAFLACAGAIFTLVLGLTVIVFALLAYPAGNLFEIFAGILGLFGVCLLIGSIALFVNWRSLTRDDDRA